MPLSSKLSLRGVTKRYGDVLAVDELSLRVEEGEFLSLLGPSGCGKSTTLAMIAGLETVTAGDIRVDGVRVNDMPPQERKIGLVFQDYAIFTKMTVFDNLAFGLRARGMGRAATRGKVTAMAEFLDLASRLGNRANALTMSELQRVALGRVLVLEPALLLLDEPLSNLDAAFRAHLRTELRTLQRRLHQTVVYVTHDHVEAMTMSDRIAVMDRGRLLQVDTPRRIYNHPRTRFVAEFLGEPPINLLPCTIERRADGAVAIVGALRVDLPADTVQGVRWLLGVRPQNVTVLDAPLDGAVSAIVDLVEPLGPETVLHLRFGEHLVQAVVPPSRAAKPGEQRWIGIPPGATRLVNADTDEVVI